MIKLIIGNKGSGKTKKLIDLVNAAAKTNPGSVVCVEKGGNLTLNVAKEARLIDVDGYGISGYDEYYAMLCGIAASNYDITHIFGDATKKIGGGLEGIEDFFKRLSANKEIEYVFTVSCDEADLPASVLELAEKL